MKSVLKLHAMWMAMFPCLLYSQDYWQETGLSNTSSINCVVSDSSGNILVGTWGKGVYRSTNDGVDWLRINDGMLDSLVYNIAVHPSGVIFAAVEGITGMYRSTDNGDHWGPGNSGIPPGRVTDVLVNTNGEVLASASNAIYHSTNAGDRWERIDSSHGGVHSMIKNRTTSTIFGLTVFGGVFRSTDDGAHWDNTSLNQTYLGDIAIDSNGYVFVGGGNRKTYRSTNNGGSWDTLAGGSPDAITLTVNSKNHIFAGGPPSGVFKSTDGGQSWGMVNQGLLDTNVWVLATDPKGYVYAGTQNGRLFRTAQSTTSVPNRDGEEPKQFTLEQNYPNPFNPRTIIQFAVPKASHVTLSIFDIFGEEIATLVSERLPAGSYTRQWNPTNVASGVYLYRLQAPSFTETKKLILLK